MYERASIPLTNSKQRIIQQIQELVSKRKEVNKRKLPGKIQEFQKTLGELFVVVKKLTDVPRLEREFYLDQCSENPKETISDRIDKQQTRRNLRMMKINSRCSQSHSNEVAILSGSESDYSSTSDSDVSLYEDKMISSGTYFTTQHSSAAAGICQ